jgi:hypothetical protein
MSKDIDKNLDKNEKYYEKLIILRDPNNQILLKALEIVKKYLIRQKESCIITGGYAIHLALKSKKFYLYEDYVLPDYDFLTSSHYSDCYEIAQWLNRINLKEISVINAIHTTTMRVRVAMQTVADGTYIPENILKNIPVLYISGFKVVHPHFQMIDMHRSLSLPYENPPFETINYRWKKDMERYDLLYEYFPIRELGKMTDIKISIPRQILIDNIKNQCISGFVGLLYWIKFAKNLGFKSELESLGNLEITNKELIIEIPIDSHGISIYTNNLNELYNNIKNQYKKKIEERFYRRFGDKLPRKIILNNEWELLDNLNQYLAAHKTEYGFYVANLQNIMLYLLTNYILIQKIKNIPRGNSFYIGYLIARELVKFGGYKNIPELLPTYEYYGINNYSESYLHSKYLFDLKNDPKHNKKTQYPLQPKNLYDTDMKYKKIPKYFYEFNPENSELFHIDGEQCDKFL